MRLKACSNWLVAILVGVQCGATLYALRSGRFHQSIWADGFARTQQRGLLLCVACVIVGRGLWTLHCWSRGIEALLFVPKLYCAYLLFWLYAISGSWVHLLVLIAVASDAGLVILLWAPNVGAHFRISSMDAGRTP